VPLDPRRTLAELRDLAALTSDRSGAQRVCWTPTWRTACEWFKGKLASLPVEVETDAAGNIWATLRGESDRALLIGGHLDSVPNGGWLDGCLNVLAGLEVLRTLSARGRPPMTLRLVSWADEEGARFGRSLVGSSAASGTIDVELLRGLHDQQGSLLPDVLRANGVDLDRMLEARGQLRQAAAYLELHIEQGPVLEELGLPLGTVLGTVGLQRHIVRFTGQAAHAGSTPIRSRRDPFLSAARLALETRRIAISERGLATTGICVTRPGIATAVAAECEITVDLRHAEDGALHRILAAAIEAGSAIAREEGVDVRWERLFEMNVVRFDGTLIDLCEEAVVATAGRSHQLFSGPLHDAVEVARAGIPTGMIFVRSLRGLSHTKDEDTPEEDLELAVKALALAVDKAIARVAVAG
jgi:N-carbamoyl-L-amino-acid hydrolase